MARIVRRVVRRRHGGAAPGTLPGTGASEKVERSDPSVMLIGRTRFRALLCLKFAAGRRVRIEAEADADMGTFSPVFAPKVDVVLVQAGEVCPSRSIEVARAVQHRHPGAGVVLVIESLTRRHLAEYWWELSNWSLLRPAACDDLPKLTSIVESAARGIRWVEPEFGRILEEVARAGGIRAFGDKAVRELPDFTVVHGDWSGRTGKAQGTDRSDGTWLTRLEPPGTQVV